MNDGRSPASQTYLQICGCDCWFADGWAASPQQKGLNLGMLMAASAAEKDNGVALKEAQRNKEAAEERIREIKRLVRMAPQNPSH